MYDVTVQEYALLLLTLVWCSLRGVQPRRREEREGGEKAVLRLFVELTDGQSLEL